VRAFGRACTQGPLLEQALAGSSPSRGTPVLTACARVQGCGGERQTPLSARIREPTEEERAEAAARQRPQPETQSPLYEGNGTFPPLPVRPHGDRDSNSTGSTNSTEKSMHHSLRTPSTSDMSKHGSAALQAKLAMDALERRDYELLALITQSAHGNDGNDAAAVDQPGGPRAPGTPTRPAGSAAYVSDQSRPGQSFRKSAFRNVEQPRSEGAYVCAHALKRGGVNFASM
jgi:hypothetical protein